LVLTLTTTLIGDFFKGANRDRWLSSQTAVATIASIVLFNVGGLLGAMHGWRGPYFAYLIALVLLIGILVFTWEPKKDAAEAAAAQQAAAGAKVNWLPLIGICAVTVLAAAMFYVTQIQASVALTQLGVTDPQRIGMLTSIASLGVPLGTLIFPFLFRVRVPHLLLCEFVLLGIGFYWMSKATDVNTFLIAAAINQVGAGMILPTLLTWAMRGLIFEVRGRGTGIWQSAFAIGQFISPIVIAMASPAVGGLFPALGVLGMVCGGAAAIALVSSFRRPSQAAVAA
jgi:MFS family permease